MKKTCNIKIVTFLGLLMHLFALKIEAQAQNESTFIKFYNAQSYAGKINAIDTLEGSMKLKCFPLIKNDLQVIKEKAITDNKTDMLDKLIFIDAEMYYLNRNYYKSIPLFIDLLTKH